MTDKGYRTMIESKNKHKYNKPGEIVCCLLQLGSRASNICSCVHSVLVYGLQRAFFGLGPNAWQVQKKYSLICS